MIEEDFEEILIDLYEHSDDELLQQLSLSSGLIYEAIRQSGEDKSE